MATLHVRNVPETLYQRIHKLAKEDNRSLTAEVIQLLNRAIQERETRQSTAAMLGRIQRRAEKVTLPSNWVDSVDLIREGRNR